MERACDHAIDEGHAALILDIDTPGGEIELMWQLSRRLDRASEDGLLTAAWVHDRATSAGSLLALSCERVYMSPTSTIGSAAPVVPGPAGIAPIPEEGGVREKVTSLLRSQFRAVAERHGRPPALAEAMRPSSGIELQRKYESREASSWSVSSSRGSGSPSTR